MREIFWEELLAEVCTDHSAGSQYQQGSRECQLAMPDRGLSDAVVEGGESVGTLLLCGLLRFGLQNIEREQWEKRHRYQPRRNERARYYDRQRVQKLSGVAGE